MVNFVIVVVSVLKVKKKEYLRVRYNSVLVCTHVHAGTRGVGGGG